MSGSGLIKFLGVYLIIYGIAGFVFTLFTSPSIIDANFFFYIFVLIIAVFILKRKHPARIASLIMFSIYLAIELIFFILFFNSDLTLRVPIQRVVYSILYIISFLIPIVVLSLKSVKLEFKKP